MDKYSGLPDIEQGPQQVFESSDVEDEPVIPSVEVQAVDSDVDESGTDVADAKRAFKHEFITGEWDFLGNVGNPISSGYRVVLKSETVDEKLARIATELQEIKLQADSAGGELVTDKNKFEEMVTLVEELSRNGTDSDAKDIRMSAPYKKRVQEAFELASTQLSFKEDETYESSAIKADRVVLASAILELESRIHQLEEAVGPGDDSKQSIQGQLRELGRRANLVYNPEYHTAKLSEEVEKLNANVEKYLSNRRLAQIGARTTPVAGNVGQEGDDRTIKIDEVYNRIPDFDKMKAVLPGVLQRLKSLHLVHAEMGGCTRTITELDKTLGSLESEIVKWDESVNEVNERLDKQDLLFDQNKQVIEKWVSQLEEKVKK